MRSTIFLLFVATTSLAQSPARPPLELVLPQGLGSISVPNGGDWIVSTIHLYPDGPRPVLQISNKSTGITASYILFANDTKGPTSEACRTAILDPMLKSMRDTIKLENVQQSSYITKDGRTLLTGSHFIPQLQDAPVKQQNVFAFIGDEKNCAEVHLSKAKFTPADQALFNQVLDTFTYDPTHVATSMDYALLANIFYVGTHDYASAAVYFQRALDVADTPAAGPNRFNWIRFITDQLAMSYGISGDLKRSRAVNEAAILKDPTYPLYYYNLACADAEAGDATAARTHLQQASDRRANTIRGESLPDPTKDDSILKLKKNKDFWAFVQSLPKT